MLWLSRAGLVDASHHPTIHCYPRYHSTTRCDGGWTGSRYGRPLRHHAALVAAHGFATTRPDGSRSRETRDPPYRSPLQCASSALFPHPDLHCFQNCSPLASLPRDAAPPRCVPTPATAASRLVGPLDGALCNTIQRQAGPSPKRPEDGICSAIADEDPSKQRPYHSSITFEARPELQLHRCDPSAPRPQSQPQHVRTSPGPRSDATCKPCNEPRLRVRDQKVGICLRGPQLRRGLPWQLCETTRAALLSYEDALHSHTSSAVQLFGQLLLRSPSLPRHLTPIP